MNIPERYRSTWSLPGANRLAFTVGVPFEAFINQSQISLVAKAGARDAFSLSYADYGWKVGIWRLLELLDAHGLRASMSVNGLAALRHPDIVRTIAEAGHEVVGHGWANDVHTKNLGRDGEGEDITRVTEAIAQAAGCRPIGWTSPGSSGSDDTVELLSERGYKWVGDDASDDVPFKLTTASGPFAILPRTNLFTNDLTQWALPRNSPEEFWTSFKYTFDQLYEEGRPGRAKWIDLTLHSHIAGRATLVPAIRRCIAYARSHDGVYYARKCDLALDVLGEKPLAPDC